MRYRYVVPALLVAAVCVVINACVTRPTYVIDSGAAQTNRKSGASVTIVDKRPAEDRESSIGSLVATSDRYGIYVLGDERFTPAPTVVLASRTEHTLSGMTRRPSSVTITLNRFNTQNNMQTAMRHGAVAASGLKPLGIELAEAMLGKLREENIDARKPFVITYAEMGGIALAGQHARHAQYLGAEGEQLFRE
jgi:hypothetical protein